MDLRIIMLTKHKEHIGIFAVFLCILITTIPFYVKLRCRRYQEACEEVINKHKDKLFKVSYLLCEMKRRQRALIRVLGKSVEKLEPDMTGPSIEYENVRNRIYSNVKELSYYVKSASKHFVDVEQFFEEIASRKRTLLLDIGRLQKVDGYSKWRTKENQLVSNLVHRRLYYLQNPKNCTGKKKHLCALINGLGFGSIIHHLAHCFVLSYATERTLVVDRDDWDYDRSPWDDNFELFSKTCHQVPKYKRQVAHIFPDVYWAALLRIPHIAACSVPVQSIHYPLSVPHDIASRLQKFTTDPAAWWLGTIIAYFLKPKQHLLMDANKIFDMINFTTPIVGVQVRRRDKYFESAYIDIYTYMEHVEDYYRTLELTTKVQVRRVYLASDDLKLFDIARKKYPNYVFLGNMTGLSDEIRTRRDIHMSLEVIYSDIMVLTKCDYVVCTFSSNICRIAYELMITKKPDASHRVHSVDDVFFFWGQRLVERVAVISHNATSPAQISFEAGEYLVVDTNNYNGFGVGAKKSQVSHEKTRFKGTFEENYGNGKDFVKGLFPWYKTAPVVRAIPCTVYPDVPLF